MDDDWDPMMTDYNSVEFNSYNRGLGANLGPEQLTFDPNHGTAVQLYVVGIPKDFNDATLKNLFAPHGHVLECFVCRRRPGKETGFGFVTMSNLIEVDAVMRELNGKNPYNLKIQIANDRTKKKDADLSRPNSKFGNRPSQGTGKGRGMLSTFGTQKQEVDIQVRPVSRVVSPNLTIEHGNSVIVNSVLNNLNTARQLKYEDDEEVQSDYHSDGRLLNRAPVQNLVKGFTRVVINSPKNTSLFMAQRMPAQPCLTCGRQAGVFRCFLCKAWYCDQNCQLDDWPQHKMLCTPPVRQPESIPSPSIDLNLNQQLRRDVQNNIVASGRTVVKPRSDGTLRSARHFPLDKPDSKTAHQNGTTNKGWQDKTGTREVCPMNPPVASYILSKQQLRQPHNQTMKAHFEESGNKVKTSLPPQKPLAKGDKVAVCYLSTPQRFWLHNCKESNSIEEMGSRLQLAMQKAGSGLKAHLREGSLCAALYSEDGAWYRAIILPSVVDPETSEFLMVYYVDYGNVEKTAAQNLLPLPQEFFKISAQAYECSLKDLHGRNGAGWTSKFVDGFKSLVNDKVLIIKEAAILGNVTHLVVEDLEGSDIGLKVGAICNLVKPIKVLGKAADDQKDTDLDIPSVIDGLSIGEEFTMAIAHLKESSFEFFVSVAKQDLSDIISMEQKLNNGQQLTSHTGFVDDYVAAKSVDGMFYRACILSANESDPKTYKVLFVDYGNEETVTELQKLALSDLHIPSPCLHLKFSDMTDSKTIEKFYSQHVSVETSIPAKVLHLENEVATLAWLNASGQQICELKAHPWSHGIVRGNSPIPDVSPPFPTVSSSKTTSKEISQSRASNSSESPTTKLESFVETTTQQLETFRLQTPQVRGSPAPNGLLASPNLPTCLLKQGEVFEGYIIWVESPLLLYAQKSKNEKQLAVLMSILSETCNSEEAINVNVRPPKHSFIASRYIDGLWYRSKVTMWNGNETEVLLFDYGNKHCPTKQNMRVLPEKFMSEAPFAYPFTLDRVTSLDSESKELLMQNLWTMEVVRIENGLPVLVVRSDTVCVNDVLAVQTVETATAVLSDHSTQEKSGTKQCDLVSPKDISILAKTNASLLTSVSSAKIAALPIIAKAYPKVDLKVKRPLTVNETFECLVGWIVSANELYIQRVTDTKKRDEMMVLIHKHCSQDSPPKSFGVGEFVCALFIDELWYRAKIKKVSGDSIEVEFVDYGNSHSLKLRDIRNLPQDEVMRQPSFAYKVSLDGVTEVDEEVSEILMKEPWALKVVSAGEVPSVIFSSLEGTCSINELLRTDPKNEETVQATENQVVEKDDHKTENVIDVTWKMSIAYDDMKMENLVNSGTCRVQVNWVNSPDLIFVSNLQNSDAFLELSVNLNKYSLELDISGIKTLPPIGALVLARFTADEAWYRALVIAKRNSEVDVLFIDFGNQDTLSLGSLAPIPSQFLLLPVQAITCQINGLNTDVEITPEFISELKTALESKLLQVEVISFNTETHRYHINIAKIQDLLIQHGFISILNDPQPNLAAQLAIEGQIKALQNQLLSMQNN